MKTLLVVDDVPANLTVLTEAAIAAGFRILLAEDGERALRLAAKARPDLILLDVIMPGLDGLATCRRLKADSATRDIPVIFVTALDETTDKVAGLEAGAVDYVTKPLQPVEVLARVRVHLELRELQARLAERNAELESARRALGQSLDSAVIVTTVEGQVLFQTARATRLLLRHFATEAAPDDALPRALLSEVTKPAGANPGGVGEIATPAGRLRWRGFAEVGGGDCLTLWLEETNENGAPRLVRLGLTPREGEVLWWIAQGKSNAEISMLLANSLNTVKKQVRCILEKLGCESRLAAALRAQEALKEAVD